MEPKIDTTAVRCKSPGSTGCWLSMLQCFPPSFSGKKGRSLGYFCPGKSVALALLFGLFLKVVEGLGTI